MVCRKIGVKPKYCPSACWIEFADKMAQLVIKESGYLEHLGAMLSADSHVESDVSEILLG